MFAAIGFFTCGQDVLGLGMRESDMLLRMALFLPGIRFFLLLRVFRASDGSLRAVCEHPELLEFGKLLDDLFQRTALSSLRTDVAAA